MSASNKNKNKDNEFPPQKREYKIRVKNGAGWRSFKTCRLQISVGQARHQGEKFLATLEWARERFEEVIVCVNDTLQRFNLMHELNVGEAFAYSKSMKEGQIWIEKNLPYKYPDVKITRWNDWTTSSAFTEQLKLFEKLYNLGDTVFRRAIDEEAREFASRRTSPMNQSFYELCRRFLIEETAVFVLMIRELEAVDIYPGTTLMPLRMMQEGQIREVDLQNRVHFTRVDFVRQKTRLSFP